MALLSNFLKGIADAIRSKKGTTEPISAQNFASEIDSIEDRLMDFINNNITEISIPPTMETIPSYAFYNNDYIEYVCFYPFVQNGKYHFV